MVRKGGHRLSISAGSPSHANFCTQHLPVHCQGPLHRQPIALPPASC